MLWFAYRIFSLRNITFTITIIITVSVTKFYFFLALTEHFDITTAKKCKEQLINVSKRKD